MEMFTLNMILTCTTLNILIKVCTFALRIGRDCFLPKDFICGQKQQMV